MNNSTALESAGITVFAAWQTGEKTGDYVQMKEFITEGFIAFSHPLLGRHDGHSARETFLKLMDDRTLSPNELSFRNLRVTAQNNQIIFQFDSAGTVMNQAQPYDGFNLIALTFEAGVLTGFEEYFGFVDPQWFARG